MIPDRNIITLARDIDAPVRCMCDDVDFRVAAEKIRHDIPHCELSSRDGRRIADDTGGFTEPIAHGDLSQFGLTQHHSRVAIELSSGVGHAEPA